MLNDELKKVNCEGDAPFETSGIILFSPVDKVFCKIAFGDGTNADSLEDDCDDYMWLSKDCFNSDGEIEVDVDGGQMDFSRKGYSGFINDGKLIRDCLKFMNYEDEDIEKMVFIQKFHH